MNIYSVLAIIFICYLIYKLLILPNFLLEIRSEILHLKKKCIEEYNKNNLTEQQMKFLFDYMEQWSNALNEINIININLIIKNQKHNENYKNLIKEYSEAILFSNNKTAAEIHNRFTNLFRFTLFLNDFVFAFTGGLIYVLYVTFLKNINIKNISKLINDLLSAPHTSNFRPAI